jgi:hypothetical protein
MTFVEGLGNFRFWHKADMLLPLSNVRLWR